MDSNPRIRCANADFDPQLQLASAPFATWVGVVEVRAGGDAFLLRANGEEDRIPAVPAIAGEVEAALADECALLVPGSGVWLPMAVLYPVLEHLPAGDAFDVAARMPPPRAQFVDPPHPRRSMLLRAALVDGEAGWIGACPAT